MKQIALLSAFLLVLDVSRAQDVEAEIDQIRTWFKATELNLKSYKTIAIDGGYTEGVNETITGYFDEALQKFVKISIESMGDWYEEKAEYYFHNERLYFSFLSGNSASEFYTNEELGITDEESFESGPEAKTIEYFEHRHYYDEETCIRYLSKSKAVAASEGIQTLTDVENKTEDCSKDDVEMLKTDLGDYLTRLRSAMYENR
jgi:hypothetical protein